MYVINNFSNQSYANITIVDKLIWMLSLIHYKKLGYTTKLYCEESDIQFLKDNHLYKYYDEIDTMTIAADPVLPNINNKEFWFWRKIVAIEKEFEMGHDFFYSDTDIILRRAPRFRDCDLYVWWFEDRDSENWHKRTTVYCDWDDISQPLNYDMPDYIRDTGRDNYNCGLLWFKDKSIFDLWKANMLDFIIDNPCEFYRKEVAGIKAVFACNAEQRMLRGVANHLNLKVKAFDNQILSNGITPIGAHFFFWRAAWRGMAEHAEDRSYTKIVIDTEIALRNLLCLADFVKMWLKQLRDINCIEEYEMFMSNKYISDLLKIKDLTESLVAGYTKY